MHKNRVRSSKPKVEKFRCEQLLSSAKKDLDEWATSLKRSVRSQTRKFDYDLPLSKGQLLITYLEFLAELRNVDRFDPDSPYNHNPQLTAKSESTIKGLLLDSNLFSINKEKTLVASVALESLPSLRNIKPESLQNVVLHLLIYSKGFIPLNNSLKLSLKDISRSAYGELRYYSSDISDNILAIFSVGYERIPFFNQKNKEIDHFKLNFCIQLEEILTFGEGQSQESRIKKFIDTLESGKDQQTRFSYCFNEWSVDENSKKDNLEYFNWKDSNKENKEIRKVQALPFKQQQCTHFESSEALFKQQQELFYKQFVSEMELQSRLFDKEHKYFTQESEISYSRARDYVDFISKIPNFKFKLTKQQREVLEKDGNLIVIGRSGTGKTLLSILRLYAIEFLSKSSIVYREMREGRFTKTCIHHQIDKCFIEKNVFLTASSYLIEQIMKQYRDMHSHIQKEHKKVCQECKELLHIGLKLEGDNLDLQEILQRIDRRESICSSVSELKKEYFPEFFTVKSIINIFDCGLQRPFFSLQATRELKNKERKVINIYWENTYRIYEPYEENLQMIFKNRLRHYTDLQLSSMEGQDKTLVAVEIDYKIFSQSIWKEISSKYFKSIKKQRSKLNASVVWAEIFSIIKGSVKAHTTHLKCLSPAMYLEESKGLFLNEEEKMDIYYLFQEYQIYKIQNKCYDMMDVVNHILQELMLGKYDNERLDYMFIDEVQDLTPATIYLLTKMTKKNLLYCGDTAQAISKGVTFKFSEIRSFFSKKYFKGCIEKEITNKEEHLTVNFRSHNMILKLANTIVSMIKELFPNTIDILESERSDLLGPKPILIDNGDERLIYDLLLSPSQVSPEDLKTARQKVKFEVFKIQQKNHIKATVLKGGQKELEDQHNKSEECQNLMQQKQESIEQLEEAQSSESSQSLLDLNQEKFLQKAAELMNRQLSSEQAILVRNAKQKSNLPCFLKKQIQLTCEEVKGLEYQDIVIYNFFQSSPCRQKWALLDSLDITCKYVCPQQFQSNINRRSIEEGVKDVASELDQQTMLYLGYDFEKKMYKVLDLARNSNYAKIDIKEFHQIASELKIFYTMVTRAKNTVIIFDRKIPRQLLRLFQELDIVEPITPEKLPDKQREIKSYKQKEGQDRYLIKANLWNEEAVKLLVRDNFDEAIKCFQRAENEKGVKRVQAMKIEKMVNCELFRLQTQFQKAEKLSKEEYQMKVNKLTKEKNSLNEDLQRAGQLYYEIGVFIKAGEIFMKIKHYQQAIRCLQKTDKSQELGEAYFQISNFEKAAEFFEKQNNNISRIIDCYIKLEKWPKVLTLMKKYKKELKKNLAEKESTQFKKHLNVCLKEMFDSVVKDKLSSNSQSLYDEISEKEKKIRRTFLEQAQQIGPNRFAQINHQYNLFTINMIYQKLSKKKEESLVISKQIKSLKVRYRQMKENENSVSIQKQKCEAEINQMVAQLSRKKMTTLQIEDQSNKNSKLLNQLSIIQSIRSGILGELQYIATQLIEVQLNLEKAKKETIILDSESLDKEIKTIEDFIGSLQKITEKFKTNLLDRTANFKKQHSSDKNAIYKIQLCEDSIEKVFKQVHNIYAMCSSFVRQNDIRKYSIFDYRGFRANLENILIKGNSELNEVLDMYRLLQTLNCTSLRYVLCDYYGLEYHVYWLVLEETLNNSINFFQRRKTMDSNIFINTQDSKKYLRIIGDNRVVLNKLGETSFRALVPRYATKECTYLEPMVREVAQGLILQGFYENSLMFCQEREKYILLSLFMDYDLLLKEMRLETKLRCCQDKMMPYYYFGTSKHSSRDESLDLINIFTIQKIYFDFDQCEQLPILSKPIEISEIKLSDYEIEQCEGDTKETIDQKKSQVKQYQSNIKKLQEQKKAITKQYNQYIHFCKCESENKRIQLQDLMKQHEKIQNEYRQSTKKYAKMVETVNIKYQILVDAYNQKVEKGKELNERILKLNSMQLERDYYQQTQYRQALKQIQGEITQCQRQFDSLLEHEQKSSHQFKKKEGQLKNFYQNIEKMTSQFNQIVSIQKQLQFSTKQMITQQRIAEENKKLAIDQIGQKIALIKKQEVKQAEKINSGELEREIFITMIQQKKLEIADHIKRQKQVDIRKGIEQLNIRDENQLKILHLLTQKKINRNSLASNREMVNLLVGIIASAKDVDRGTLQNHQICLIIIVYLQFLFNKEFRETCIECLLSFQREIENQIQQIRGMLIIIQSKIKQKEKNIYQLHEKIQKQEKVFFLFSNMKKLVKEKNTYLDQIKSLNIQFNFIQFNLEKCNLKMLNEGPAARLINLLSVYEKNSNISSGSQNFRDIFLGFFQCRVIKGCSSLSFLERQYVLVKADSIILKKMDEEKLLDFAFYFDCHSKVVLTTFNSFDRTLLKYLQQQHFRIENELTQLPKIFQQQAIKEFNLSWANKYEEKIDCHPSLNPNLNLDLLVLKILRGRVSGISPTDEEKLYQDFKSKELLTKAKRLKREVLEFYLGNELREKQNFFSVLYQLKEYENIETMAKGMMFFNPNTMKELTIKLKELEEGKNEWVDKQKTGKQCSSPL